ncbi:hypothetical protein JOD31_001554 [Methylopila capsulata]|uniref:Uncharacterized protein n=1 Tax=Methylopila capsulata TaxID=61654 RepID=A0A9W6MQN0_9HYPH|nr:hypothetical protein [Methylopila capsulata]MBM7851329.1 hypothetical protein [Methylopila capsulata]GLK54387.1 hypothetical protein GCM10008170_04060 [Methylopila capsulata]
MADYFPVLSRAVAGLETNTGENRRAVYERARAAIIRQLRSIDPPIAEEDIARERMQLEEAIRKVEAAHAPAPAAAPEPPRAPEPPVAAKTAAPSPAAPKAEDRPANRPAARADGRPIVRAAGERADAPKARRSGLLVALAALVVIAVVAGAVAGRQQIAALFNGGSSQTASVEPEKTDAPASTPQNAPKADGGKDSDRLLDEPAPAPAPQAPSTDVARAPEPTAPAPQTEPAPAPPAPAAAPTAAPAAPPAEARPQQGPLVAQRAILYEEGSDQQSGEQTEGTVLWRTESVNAGQNQPLETAIRGDIDIPARKIQATITIRRNADATLPASHTIEVQFRLPENFANAGVANVPGILMKADEATRGAPVQGLSVRVTNGFFLIGLSNIENERTLNEQLLRDRGWLDIPILYDNGRRAVLTLEKGTPGTQAFADAFGAWGGSTSGAQQ